MIESAKGAGPGPDSGEARRSTGNPLAAGGLLGLVGCVTVLVILVALGAGLWLDGLLGTRPILTLAAVLASVPVTLFLMFRIVLSGARRLQSPSRGSPSAPSKVGEARGEDADLEVGR